MTVRRAAGIVLALLLLAIGLAGQQSAPEPMSQSEFVGLVNAKTPAADIIAQVKARGISFQVSPELETSLQPLPEGPELLAALRAPATLEVSVNVDGAAVTVDGEKKGTAAAGAPVVVSGLAPGTHLVHAEAEQYVGERQSVFLKPDETKRVEIVLGAAVEAKPGLFGTEINVKAGTPEDALMVSLEGIADMDQRITRLQEVAQQYAGSPLSLLADEMLQTAYLRREKYDLALETGARILERDPNNLQALLGNVQANTRLGTLDAAYEGAEKARTALAAALDAPAPEGVADDVWKDQKNRAIESGTATLQNAAYELYVNTARLPHPARKAALLSRFLELYPESEYRAYALIALAYAYQQQNNPQKAVETGEKALAANANDPAMAVLVSDILSDRGENLDRAGELASGLLQRLEADPASVRPDGLGDEQWNRLRNLWEGSAHSAVGQVLMYQETATAPAGMSKTRQAIDHFLKASPLLKAEAQLYARNLFRLGFAQAKLGDLNDAQATLNEVIGLNTAYTPYAQDTLSKVQQALQKRKQ